MYPFQRNMKTDYNLIKEKLEAFPDFRKRERRGKYLAILALRALELEYVERKLTLEELVEFAIKFDSYRHAWTDCVRDNPAWQTETYSDKTILEQQKKIELGYEVGYVKDVHAKN